MKGLRGRRWPALVALLVVGCAVGPSTWEERPPDELALVDAATMLALGRLPLGQSEAGVLADALRGSTPGELMFALTRGEAYRARWRSAIYDMLGIDRLGARAQPDCFRESTDASMSEELAAFVRDREPSAQARGLPTMADVVTSALRLDDLSPVLRANLFAELANDDIEPDDLEAPGFRVVRANDFTARVLGRTAACLGCHSSEGGVTDSDDPALDRHAPHEAAVDTTVFGPLGTVDAGDFGLAFRRRGVLASMLRAWDEEGPPDGCAPRGTEVAGCEGCACEEAVCALLETCCRREWDGFCAQLCMESGTGCTEPSAPNYVAVPWLSPFGLDPVCGIFVAPEAVEVDALQGDGFLAGRLDEGDSVWELERALAAGLESVRGQPLPTGTGLSTEQAIGTLVALRVADAVWTVATGEALTVPHGLPRNEAQREVLVRLADALTRSGWSLRALLAAVADEPAFAPSMPEAGGEYELAPVWNPWSREALEPAQRGNDVGDRVRPWAARERQNAAHELLEWPAMAGFPTADERESFDQRRLEDLGAFLSDSAQGFVAIDVQAGLAWEDFAAQCRPPDGPGPVEERCSFDIANCPRDWIDDLVDAARERGASWSSAISTLRARLLRDGASSGPAEDAALAALLEVEPSGQAVDGAPLRRVCAAMLMAPSFTHWGPRPDAAAPEWRVPGTEPEAACEALASALDDGAPGPRLRCEGGGAASIEVP